MTIKRVVMILSVLLLGSASARSFKTGHFIVTLTDKESNPITDATVYVKTLNRTGLGAGAYQGHYTTFSARTDANGVADVSFQFLTSHFTWWLDTPSHHSEEVGFRSDHFVPTIVKSDYWSIDTNTVVGLLRYAELKALDAAGDYLAYAEKFEHKSVTYASNVVYKTLSFFPRRNPQAMYAYGDWCRLKLPMNKVVTTNDNVEVVQLPTVSIDLKKGCVVRQGQIRSSDDDEDFSLERFAVVTNGVKNFYGRIRFKPGCGAYKGIKSGDESFPTTYEADVNREYLSQIEFSVLRNPVTKEMISFQPVLAEDEYLVMRTRMSVDPSGRTNGWHYAKIFGPLVIRQELVFEQSVFNPEFNDTNLEFDIRRNLAGRRGQSRWP